MTAEINILDFLTPLALVLGLILLSGVALRLLRTRFGGSIAGRDLAVLAALSLDTRHRLLVVRDGATSYTLVLGGQQPLLLASQPVPDATPSDSVRASR